MAKRIPPATSLVGLIAWCKKRKGFRYKLIASYLDTYRKMNETSFADTMARAQLVVARKGGSDG